MNQYRKDAEAKQAHVATAREQAEGIAAAALKKADEDYKKLEQEFIASNDDWTRSEATQKKFKEQKKNAIKKLSEAESEAAEASAKAGSLQDQVNVMLEDKSSLLDEMKDLQQQLENAAGKHQEVQKKANTATRILEQERLKVADLNKKIKEREVDAKAKVDAAKAIADGRVEVEKAKQDAAVRKADIAAAGKFKLTALAETKRAAKAAEDAAAKEHNAAVEYEKKKLQVEKELEMARIQKGITAEQTEVDAKTKKKEVAKEAEASQNLKQLTIQMAFAKKQHEEDKEKASDILSQNAIAQWKLSGILGGKRAIGEWLKRKTGMLDDQGIELVKFLWEKMKKLVWEILKLMFRFGTSTLLANMLMDGTIHIPFAESNTLAILASLRGGKGTFNALWAWDRDMFKAGARLIGVETPPMIVPVIPHVGVAFSYIVMRITHAVVPKQYGALVNLKNLSKLLNLWSKPSHIGVGLGLGALSMAMPLYFATPLQVLLRTYASASTIIFALESIAERAPAEVSTFAAEIITGAIVQVGANYFLPTLFTSRKFVRVVYAHLNTLSSFERPGGVSYSDHAYNFMITTRSSRVADIMRIIIDNVVYGMRTVGTIPSAIAGMVENALSAVGVVLSRHWIMLILLALGVVCYYNKATIERGLKASKGLKKAKDACVAVYKDGKTWCEDKGVVGQGKEFIVWLKEQMDRLRKEEEEKTVPTYDVEAAIRLMGTTQDQSDTGPTDQGGRDELVQTLRNQGGRRADKRKAETEEEKKKKVRLVSKEYDDDDEEDMEQGGAGSSISAPLDIDLLVHFMGIALAASFAAA
jgi:hypothetical protein